jgi:hypothetical protein
MFFNNVDYVVAAVAKKAYLHFVVHVPLAEKC